MLGVIVVLVGLHIPSGIASCFEMIGSATSGVAVFTFGLTLAATAFQFSRAVVFSTVGRITVQTLVLFVLLRLPHVEGPFAREAPVCTSFPIATVVVSLATMYKAMEAKMSSTLLLSTLSPASDSAHQHRHRKIGELTDGRSQTLLGRANGNSCERIAGH